MSALGLPTLCSEPCALVILGLNARVIFLCAGTVPVLRTLQIKWQLSTLVKNSIFSLA